MHLTHLTSARRQGFRGKPLHRRTEIRLRPLSYMRQRSSFLIAAISLVAFVAGNMIGSHGIYAFWKSVWGMGDDSLIAYTGTVAPIANVPDEGCWASFGGGGEGDHTFRQVPEQCLRPLAPYDAEKQREGRQGDFEVGYMGDYRSGADAKGSHPGVDIRVPKDTQVLAIANGIVTSVREDRGGFGKLIVIRHPHMPDPLDPHRTTVLYSGYAHLDAQLVMEGDIVQKGQMIGLSGSTGFVTGAHLHFQIDRDSLPSGEAVTSHPAWPFTGQEARNAGLTLTQAIDAGLNQETGYRETISPMLYVQANYPPVPEGSVAPSSRGSSSLLSALSPQQIRAHLLSNREARYQKRLALHQQEETRMAAAQQLVVASETMVAVATVPGMPFLQPALPAVPEEQRTELRTIDIEHDRAFEGRGWETITLTLLDAQGNALDGSVLPRDLHLRTAYGDAEFRPEVLSPLDFHGGRAQVRMLPRGRRTIVILVQPFGVLSEPMKYEGK